MTDLKPCPFCGGEADLMTDELNNNNKGTIMCMSCYSTSPDSGNWQDAVKAWNTRPNPWISVKDRLPTDKKSVLVNRVYNINQKINETMNCWYSGNSEKWFWGSTSFDTVNTEGLGITHWMAIPEIGGE